MMSLGFARFPGKPLPKDAASTFCNNCWKILGNRFGVFFFEELVKNFAKHKKNRVLDEFATTDSFFCMFLESAKCGGEFYHLRHPRGLGESSEHNPNGTMEVHLLKDDVDFKD